MCGQLETALNNVCTICNKRFHEKCNFSFLQNHGRQMVKMLVRHGANLEYVDHALRNALYWSVYNCCGEITTFLLDCGAKVKPWSWIADEALPASFTEDSQIFSRITKARQEPHSLLIQTRYSAFLKLSKI